MMDALALVPGVPSAELSSKSDSEADSDPDLEGAQVNLKSTKDLDPGSFKAVEKIVCSMLREAE